MAVEIKEIVIRAVLSEEEKSTKRTETPLQGKTDLVQECVNQVLKILSKKNLR